jgi:hypothetical protein
VGKAENNFGQIQIAGRIASHRGFMRYPLFWIFCLFAAPAALQAQLSPADKRAAEKMVAGDLYLRLDVPIDTYRVVPLLEVSPDGADSARKIADLSEEDRQHVEWLFNPNDKVGRITLRWGYNSVRLWGAKGLRELLIDFVHLKNLADFSKAFDRTFSRVPLQDSHTEWPPEVRKAIAERTLIEGMTREQAAAVVGTPESIETSKVEGVEVEIWHPRMAIAKRRDAKSTGFPASLKFQDGKLTLIEQPVAPIRKK